MKALMLLIVFLSHTTIAATIVGDGAEKKDLVKVSTLLENPKKYLDKEVTVEGTVIKVCSRTGCKMFLASDKKYSNLMIKAKSKKMVFPLGARGKKALAKGTFTRIAKKDHEHKNCDEIDKYRYLVQATGAKILD